MTWGIAPDRTRFGGRRRGVISPREKGTSGRRILLVEDHQRLASSIAESLAGFGFGVDFFSTAEERLAASKSLSYDAILLDLGLPDRDGLDVIQGTARGDELASDSDPHRAGRIDDRVEGLDRGADDYMLKLFAMKELAARLRALLRRPGGPMGNRIDIANITLDTTAQQLRRPQGRGWSDRPLQSHLG